MPLMRRALKAARLLLIPLLLLATLVSVLPYVPQVHAVGPVLQQEKNNDVAPACSATTTCTLTFTNNVGTNDLEVVNIYTATTAATGFCRSVSSVVGTLSGTFTVAANTNCAFVAADNLYEQELVYYFFYTAAAGKDQITVTTSGSTFVILMSIQDYSGQPTLNVAPTSTCTVDPHTSAGLPQTYTCSSNLVWGGGTPLIVGELYVATGASQTAGAGYTLVFNNCPNPSAGVCGEYGTGVSSPSNVPYQVGGSGQTPTEAEVGVVFDSSVIVTVVVTVPCGFFNLQCWWYPLLFMGMYSGFLLLIGTWLRTSPRGKSHIFLSAITFGSLVAVIFGIMNIVFPLLMLILNTIIVLRLRG